MSSRRSISDHDGRRPTLYIPNFKEDDLVPSIVFPDGECALSPDIQSPGFSPDFTCAFSDDAQPPTEVVDRIGNYLLLEKLSSTATVETRKALHIGLQEEFICKILPLNKYREILAPYWQSGFHPHIANIVEILLGEKKAYVIFQQSFEDLHSYIRRKRYLKEAEAAKLFHQIALAIKHCHNRGIVLRDLKLRKFTFNNHQRTHLVLDNLEDAFLLADSADDRLTDKHGCPAYVSPEILSSAGYSGKSADMWSLGVVLYTMLFGQYPFHDTNPCDLFGKIRRGHYSVPDGVSAPARCLVKCLLRTTPSERLTINEACKHPWFAHGRSRNATRAIAAAAVGTLKANVAVAVAADSEHVVPDVPQKQTPDNFDI